MLLLLVNEEHADKTSLSVASMTAKSWMSAASHQVAITIQWFVSLVAGLCRLLHYYHHDHSGQERVTDAFCTAAIA